MGLSTDDEIVQDFLVEAGEILEKLNGQLVELERRPDDKDLLNAVFRGFHTIKGGAGFLKIDNLVEVCHRAEDVFNVLRQGKRAVDAALMDVVLPVLDVVNAMFEVVRGGEFPAPAERELVRRLEALADPNAPVPAAAAPKKGGKPSRTAQAAKPEPVAAPASAAAAGGDITDDEFEALLDQLHGKGQPVSTAAEPAAPATPPPPGGTISDDEFEALLDELHGKGKHVGRPASAATEEAPAPAAPKAVPTPAAAKPAAPPPQPQAETTVRVDTKRLDDIMNLVGELVLVRNRLSTLRTGVGDDAVTKAIANLGVVTTDLQLAVMKTRMQPIKKVFGRFPRVVRDLARQLQKDVALELVGEDTDLDKNLVEALADPLVHLVRNSIDHGVEMPEVREQAGKPRQGTVTLSAEQEGDHILLSIEDDGAGMDPDVLRRKAVEKGLMDAEAAERLSEREAFGLIFLPGFSTKAQISDVSGRGVGMDVVKTRIGQLNGMVEILSEPGRGTRINIKVPLTLAILPALMVVLGEQRFALPLANVSEILELDLTHTKVVDGQLVAVVREKALPLFYLRDWLVRGAARAARPPRGHVVVVNTAHQQVGFVVDQLIGQEEVVIKPLGAFVSGVAGMAGATITGDGRIALILDVPGLLRAYARRWQDHRSRLGRAKVA